MSTTRRIGSAGLEAALWAAAQTVSSSKVFHLLNLSFSLDTKTLWPPSLVLRWKPKLCRVKCPFLLQAHTWCSPFLQGSILARPYSRVLWADKHCLVCRLVMVPLAGSQLHHCCWECGTHSARPMPSASRWDTWMHFSRRMFLMRKPCPSATAVQPEHGLICYISKANTSPSTVKALQKGNITHQTFPGRAWLHKAFTWPLDSSEWHFFKIQSAQKVRSNTGGKKTMTVLCI